MTATARYMYAVTRGIDATRIADVTGIDGGVVHVVRHRGLSAVVSDVSLEEYGEEALHQNLERLDWLEEVARSHDGVVQAVATAGPTAPLRLATICLDDSGVRQRLDDWHDALHQVLDRVEGRAEWSVKVFSPSSPAEQEAPKATSGADYLRNKSAAAHARAVLEETSLRAGEEIHGELSQGTVASRRLAAQDPRLSGHSGEMLLNGAYLVPADEHTSFERRVREVAAAHPAVTVAIGGPWPPYSFATLEQT